MAKTILIADDSESIRTILKLTLKFKGYAILEAADGTVAYDILQKNPCDMVITDIMMPGLTGVELLQKIRKEMKNPDIPVIICTAEKNVDDEELIQKGATRILMKPVQPKELMEVVNSLI